MSDSIKKFEEMEDVPLKEFVKGVYYCFRGQDPKRYKVKYKGDGEGTGLWNSTFREAWSISDKSRWYIHPDQTPLDQHKADEVTVGKGNLEGNNKRVFESGASRNSDEGKLDFEGFLSPKVLEEYAKYMHKHRQMEDGTLRDSDNWQKGIPKDAYMKSMWRHFFDVWKNHRGIETEENKVTNLCAVIFNAMGMLHEELKG